MNPDAQPPRRGPALAPCVVVHGPADARAALLSGRPVTLLSAPGAALFAGFAWWRGLVDAARSGSPTPGRDVLDCADAAGLALEAIGLGQALLVLDPGCAAFPALARRAAARGGALLAARPPALDLARRGAERLLADWLG